MNVILRDDLIKAFREAFENKATVAPEFHVCWEVMLKTLYKLGFDVEWLEGQIYSSYLEYGFLLEDILSRHTPEEVRAFMEEEKTRKNEVKLES